MARRKFAKRFSKYYNTRVISTRHGLDRRIYISSLVLQCYLIAATVEASNMSDYDGEGNDGG